MHFDQKQNDLSFAHQMDLLAMIKFIGFLIFLAFTFILRLFLVNATEGMQLF